MKNLAKYAIQCTLTLFSVATFAQVQEITAECTTRGTEISGKRNSCYSDPITKITAPKDHVFAERTLQGGLVRQAGSERRCIVGWDNYIEIIPGTGITQPTTITLQAHARSPRGYDGRRGWAACKYSVRMSKYQN
jgi:hypothetical protein